MRGHEPGRSTADSQHIRFESFHRSLALLGRIKRSLAILSRRFLIRIRAFGIEVSDVSRAEGRTFGNAIARRLCNRAAP